MRTPREDVSPVVAWSAPILLVIPFLIAQRALDPATLERVMDGERALMENLTVLISLLGLYLAVRVAAAARGPGGAAPRGLSPLMVCFAAGFLYIAGEEASWGQHWLGLDTPEWLAEVNYQQETNVHNLHIQIDKAPKTLLMIAMILGGLVRPLWRRPRGKGDPRGRLSWVWPTECVLPTAVALLLLWIYSRFVPGLDRHRVGGSEHRELIQVAFLLLYTLSFRRRFLPARRRDSTSRLRTARGTPA